MGNPHRVDIRSTEEGEEWERGVRSGAATCCATVAAVFWAMVAAAESVSGSTRGESAVPTSSRCDCVFGIRTSRSSLTSGLQAFPDGVLHPTSRSSSRRGALVPTTRDTRDFRILRIVRTLGIKGSWHQSGTRTRTGEELGVVLLPRGQMSRTAL
jgi:hypothetical protein